MGKAARKKRNVRFNPMERAEAAGVEARESKGVSAHQARHAERKRLQAQAAELKRQRVKLSKGMNVVQRKAEKKALGKSLHAVKAQAAALKREKLSTPTAEAHASSSPPFAFHLPAATPSDVSNSWPAHQTHSVGEIPTMKG
ncbi:MAG: hypothetical protein SGPRY_014623 [Prymnesium sp.]